KHLDVPLEELRVGSEVIEHLPMMIAQLDEPVADLAPLNVLLISQAAHRAGMKVLLSGAGGDDLFTGYRRHRALLLSKYWGWLPQGFRSRMASFAGHLPSSPHAFRRLRKLLELAGGSEAEQCIGYFHWLSTPLLRGLLSEEFLATAQRDPVEQFYHTLSPALSPLEKMLALEQRFFLADHNLMYTDKMSMAAGIEVRVPLLDQEVVRYASQLPDTFLQRGSEGKWILKKAAEQYLPRDVIYRPKTGFGTPLRAWMGGPLRPLREELLSKEVVESRGWLSFPALARLMAEHDQGKRDATYPLFALLCLELWARRTIDGSISSFGQTRGDKTQSDLRASG
ncbi:asparagine synthase C-terminal domain-containing protein, partial [bacterium]|nr:asparagine synthase C-terminal domain-containing protein [bacterium]